MNIIEDKLNFFTNIVNIHNKEIIQLYIKERQSIGEGCLFINTTNSSVTNKIKMSYIPNSKIPIEIKTDLDKKYNDVNKKDSVIYFYIFDETESLLYELDLENY